MCEISIGLKSHFKSAISVFEDIVGTTDQAQAIFLMVVTTLSGVIVVFSGEVVNPIFASIL